MKDKIEIDILKQNISKLSHTLPKGLNEKKVLKELGLSTFSRDGAMKILFEMLNVRFMIKKQNET